MRAACIYIHLLVLLATSCFVHGKCKKRESHICLYLKTDFVNCKKVERVFASFPNYFCLFLKPGKFKRGQRAILYGTLVCIIESKYTRHALATRAELIER